MRVRDLELALLDMFPASDAESWDRVGLSVGDPDHEVGRVMVALDATDAQVIAAHGAGADVLVAHHPVYLDAPDRICPGASRTNPQAASAAYRAASLGVSVISLHTNLDRSLEARRHLAEILGFEPTGSLEHPGDPDAPGFGALCHVDRPLSVRSLAKLVEDALATRVRAWGNATAPLRSVAISSGALGDLGEAALAAGCDAVVTGEAGYHVCQDLAARGIAVVLAGHDATELPYREVLRCAVERAGIDSERIVSSSESRQWWTLGEGD